MLLYASGLGGLLANTVVLPYHEMEGHQPDRDQGYASLLRKLENDESTTVEADGAM